MSSPSIQPVSSFAPPVPTFLFDSRPVRIIERDGDLWFFAPDAARELGYGHTPHMLRLLDADEKGVHETDTLGGKQKITLVSEPGLYKLIARSNKPAAKRFDRWVRHEVLPAIRRTGRFSVAPALPDFSNPVRLKALLLQSLDAQIELQAQVADLSPKAAIVDRLDAARGDELPTDSAKVLKVKPKKLFDIMEEVGWAYRRGRRWVGTEKALDRKYVSHRETIRKTEFGDVTDIQILITPKGRAQLAHILNQRGISSAPVPVNDSSGSDLFGGLQ